MASGLKTFAAAGPGSYLLLVSSVLFKLLKPRLVHGAMARGAHQRLEGVSASEGPSRQAYAYILHMSCIYHGCVMHIAWLMCHAYGMAFRVPSDLQLHPYSYRHEASSGYLDCFIPIDLELHPCAYPLRVSYICVSFRTSAFRFIHMRFVSYICVSIPSFHSVAYQNASISPSRSTSPSRRRDACPCEHVVTRHCLAAVVGLKLQWSCSGVAVELQRCDVFQ